MESLSPDIPVSLVENKMKAEEKAFCLRYRCVPMEIHEEALAEQHLSSEQHALYGVETYDELLIETLQFRTGKSVRLQVLPVEVLETALNRINKFSEGTTTGTSGEESGLSLKDLFSSEIALSEDSSVEELQETVQSEPVVKLAKDLIDQGVREGATDIHLEPMENHLKVRFRKDGLLQEFMELPKWVQLPLVSRIKILAELDIAEKRLPHDGRIKWTTSTDNGIPGETVDLRVSTLPTRLGEKVVLRVLKHNLNVGRLHTLGLSEEHFKKVSDIVKKPQGIFFVTGPTGSGKSSTLYAALKEVLHRAINVSTIEDPIEYRLEGANQVQVNEKAGLSFSSALRSLLRQDPDVMLVGEIRDEETASIAVQAAQTGHLVLSTLHTNDAISAISRLKDLQVKPFLISSAVLGVLAQRLVRKVCPHCSVLQELTQEEQVAFEGLLDPTEKYTKAVGCKQCSNTGYRGRIGIFELFLLNSEIREAIVHGKSEEEIKNKIHSEAQRERGGWKPLIQDGAAKIKEGITTPEEVLRVAYWENE